MEGKRLYATPGATYPRYEGSPGDPSRGVPPVPPDPLDSKRFKPDVSVCNPGEYMKRADGTGWDAMTPAGDRCFFPPEVVTEQKDGTVTVATIVVQKQQPIVKDDGQGKLIPVIDAKTGKPQVVVIERWRGAIDGGVWAKAEA